MVIKAGIKSVYKTGTGSDDAGTIEKLREINTYYFFLFPANVHEKFGKIFFFHVISDVNIPFIFGNVQQGRNSYFLH